MPGRYRIFLGMAAGVGKTYRMLVEAHGGKLWLEDGPEAGSRFVFTLPLQDPHR